MTEQKATLIGFGAIVLWGLLALLTELSGGLPPFQLMSLCFSLAFLLILIKWILCRQSPLTFIRQPLLAWMLGVGGLSGYHFFYFLALSRAPVLEASLIAYLWPLLIVLFSACLPGERLLLRHLSGAVVALLGCWLLLGGGAGNFDTEYIDGYLAAAACALIWSCCSVAGRLVRQVPSDAVGWFCGLSALLGWICHGIWETTLWPQQWSEWLAIVGLGAGPLGLAFLAWDYGIKHGNLPLLGVLSYGAPLISTVVLILFTDATASPVVVAACLAIIAGALLASPVIGGLVDRWSLYPKRLFKARKPVSGR